MINNIQQLQLWGGIECTINRIGDTFYDQLEASGHYTREDDIALMASLGIKALRYPILWEKHQPEPGIKPGWNWITKQLNQIKNNGITPIAGLLHHGSGPAYTNLLDPLFPEKLAAYALMVARQFPWLEFYTPVNEPLTTARFSALYGHWYPHETNDVHFATALLNQLKGTVLAMKAIRTINPDAKLVQTEDLGKTYSTPVLQYQADFENNRRWTTYDILTGKLLPGHPMWDYFIRLGINEAQLYFFSENTCVPSIAGINYYVTSERYLDHNYKHYPEVCHGGNEIHRYADVEAVRVPLNHPAGFSVITKEFWERYKLPIAITEVHLGCSIDEQMRWFNDIWNHSLRLRQDGVNILAATAWSMFGAYGWDKLLTQGLENYESGVFNLKDGIVHETPLSVMLAEIGKNGYYNHPFFEEGGWWTRPDRYLVKTKPVKKRVFSKV